MQIDRIIAHLYPGAIFGFVGDVELRDDGGGPYIARWDRPEPKPTALELQLAWPAVKLALDKIAADDQAAEAERKTGVEQAKLAYSRLQIIIDTADTATTAQLRAAIKELARDVQHLIRAAVQ